MGVSGCGKSSIGRALSKKLNIPFYDGDDFHPKTNIAKMSRGEALNDEDRWPWLEAINTKANVEVEKQGAVIACSALKETYRTKLSQGLDGRDKWLYLKGDFDTILARMERRDHFMPPALLKSQFDALEEPTTGYIIDINQTIDTIVETLYLDLSGPNR